MLPSSSRAQLGLCGSRGRRRGTCTARLLAPRHSDYEMLNPHITATLARVSDRRGLRYCERRPVARQRAQILLAADAGASDEEIASSVGVGGATVYRTKRRFVIGTWRRRSAKSRAPEPTASSPAKRRPCLLHRPVRTRPKAARAGRWNSWPVNWSASPSTTTSLARPCAVIWRKTSSSPGARTCEAPGGLFR
jgi:hypothetical protein